MTNRTQDQMESLLRDSLAERAQDVEVTPALYAEVQRRATRGAWLRRGVLALGAAAAVVAGAVALPALLPDQDLQPILDRPETPAATEVPTEGAAPGEGADEGAAAFDLTMAALGLAWSDGEALLLPDANGVTRVALVDGETVRALAVEADPRTDGRWVAATIRDRDGSGAVAWVDVELAMGPERAFRARVPADPNGDGVAVVPGERPGVAWIEGTDLHVVPADATDPAAVRVVPLEGDVPDGLVAQQWVAAADAQVLLATAPDGGVWSLPMDDSDVTNTGPTAPGFRLPDGDRALDALVTPALAPTVLLEGPLSGIGSAVRLAAPEALPALLPAPFDVSTSLTLTGNGSFEAVVLDTASGAGVSLVLDEEGLFEVVHAWDASAAKVTAAAPVVSRPRPQPTDGTGATGAAALGLRTDAPLVGTAGTDIVVRLADGEERALALYPQPESEAVLGRLAVRPGSTVDDGLIAVESASEGENSIRFAHLTDGSVASVGSVLVARGPVTGLVWSPDGREVAWTDDLGLRAARVEGLGEVPGDVATSLTDDTRAVLDWRWEVGSAGPVAASGWVTVAAGGGVELLGIARAADGTLTMSAPVGGSDRVSLGTHTGPDGVGGPEVVANTYDVDGTTRVQLSWAVDGDRFGELPEPGVVGDEVRVRASGGQVVVLGTQAQVLVTFDGAVVGLSDAADWDVLD